MDWSTTVVAIAGIGGTFFAPSWSSSRLDARRARSSFRKAKRLTLDEMSSLDAQLNLLLSERRAPDNMDRVLEAPEWPRTKEPLSELLPEPAWTIVVEFFETTAILRLNVLRFETGSQLLDDTLELIATSVGQAQAAHEALSAIKKPDIA